MPCPVCQRKSQRGTTMRPKLLRHQSWARRPSKDSSARARPHTKKLTFNLRWLLAFVAVAGILLLSGPATHAQNAAFQWVQQAGSSEFDYGNGIGVDALGNSYVSGYCENPGIFGSNTTNRAGGFLAKYNGAGLLQWVRGVGSTASRVAVDRDGNSWVTGLSRGPTNVGGIFLTNAGNEDIFIGKFNSAGNVVWAVRDGGPSGEDARSIAVDPAGNVYVVGVFYFSTRFGTNILTAASQGSADVFVAKYNADG